MVDREGPVFAYDDIPYADRCHEFNRLYDDNVWLLTNSFLVLTMQAGFALMEAGCVRDFTVANIMMKNICDLGLSSLGYWAVGWGLAYGAGDNPFMGTSEFFLMAPFHDTIQWMWQFSFAATSATIDSAAMAERVAFIPYLFLSLLTTSVWYPIVAHWVWSDVGWLGKLGFIDFAGAGAVHLLGGCCAFVSAWWLGPRIGRFSRLDDEEVAKLTVLVRRAHNQAHKSMAVLMGDKAKATTHTGPAEEFDEADELDDTDDDSKSQATDDSSGHNGSVFNLGGSVFNGNKSRKERAGEDTERLFLRATYRMRARETRPRHYFPLKTKTFGRHSFEWKLKTEPHSGERVQFDVVRLEKGVANDKLNVFMELGGDEDALNAAFAAGAAA
eukprot:CAMPEP_0182878076 /NCGR_PEP_ID=MMETSP0034_2-20130328/15142_1 /TAXON_ID=156128 /ORGANISM="Nephroselmis pyriformis, Strain CCMP717" /LENGTH=384 /DNA_ID=CAMNT_0025010949 /DNA_START=82 /DNA_END=1232 /DNA_ORIENTATION=-